MSLLEQINEPRDLKKFDLVQLEALAAELRGLIIQTVGSSGGHLSSNLGVIELTIALHRVFSSPDDKIIWDVGHQCYAHKLLTGRRGGFQTLRKEAGVAGFPRVSESPHDVFNTGHASTAISIALGFLTAEKLGGGSNKSVAVIGDGALTGGMAYEALSHAGQMGLPLIVVLNDNRMSISESVGGLSEYLSRLSMKAKYQKFRETFDSLTKKIPFIGKSLFRMIVRLKRAVKAVVYTDNFFVDLGFEYVGPIEGHNIQALRNVFTDVRELSRPVVVHVITRKGAGYPPAENDPLSFHSTGPFDPDTGRPLPQSGKTWTHCFGQALLEAGRYNDRVVAITAAMERGTGLSAFKTSFPHRFFDTGIAEEHAVTFAAALAAAGMRPVVAIYSTFIQRSVDQLIHDSAIGNLPVVFVLDRAGFVGGDGETHQGLFDISIFRAIPNMTIMVPAVPSELTMMLDAALSFSGPCMIRYPKESVPGMAAYGAAETTAAAESKAYLFDAPLETGRGVFAARDEGAETCIAFTGSLLPPVQAAAGILRQEGLKTDLYNMRFLKPIDEDFLVGIIAGYKNFVVVEEGIKSGGIGEYIAAFVTGTASTDAARAESRCLETRVLTLNAGDVFWAQGSREQLLTRAGLDAQGIASSIRKAFL
ncbi:1-deoxy-D-xylulose-5-phosphate synthase [Spirochaetia bacterium]|nr:1-deoxy-D-xylulose-5-phosphate synthase [Spirochaetia bacterium]